MIENYDAKILFADYAVHWAIGNLKVSVESARKFDKTIDNGPIEKLVLVDIVSLLQLIEHAIPFLSKEDLEFLDEINYIEISLLPIHSMVERDFSTAVDFFIRGNRPSLHQDIEIHA